MKNLNQLGGVFNKGVRGIRRHDNLLKLGFLVLKNFENHKLNVMHVNHSSRASGTVYLMSLNQFAVD